MEKLNYRKFLIDIKNTININDLITNITSIFFIAITAFYPVFIGSGGYSSITYKKALFFWLATGIATIALLFIFICGKQKFSLDNYYVENEPLRKVTVAEWVLLGFVIWTLISAILSMWQNPEWANPGFGSASVWLGANSRYEGFITFLCYAITFAIVARFYKIKDLHLQLIAVSAILISLIGVLQFFGLDIFRLYAHYSPLSTLLRTTLGNVNIVSSYCSFTIMMFAALFTVSRSKWKYLYLGACICSFALSLTTGFSGDAHKIAILGSMILLIPYWISDRERLGRILIVMSSWLIVYAGHSAYMSELKKQCTTGTFFPKYDQQLLNEYTHKNIPLFLIIAVVLLIAGLTLILLLKKWHEKPMKTVGVILLPFMTAMKL